MNWFEEEEVDAIDKEVLGDVDPHKEYDGEIHVLAELQSCNEDTHGYWEYNNSANL